MADVTEELPNPASPNEIETNEREAQGDANDYSRFDNVDDTDTESEPDTTPSMSMVERLSRAGSLKDAGNDAFQTQDWARAKTSYQDAIKLLEPYKSSQPPSVTDVQRDEIRRLLSTLHSNKAMVLIKEEDWFAAIKASSDALKIDGANTKALFRRGVAHARCGLLEEAKTDLTQLLQTDTENTAAKKELANVRKLLDQHIRKQKQSFAGLFDRSGGMYEDKERERQQRERQAAEQKLKDEDDWRKDNIRRRDSGQSEQTFEEWKKKKTAESAKASNDQQSPKRSKSSSTQRKRGEPAASGDKKRSSNNNDNDDDDDYDEEEQKIISETKQKGYCYFRRQQSEEEKQLYSDVAPRKVGGEDEAAAISPPPIESEATDDSQSKRTGAGSAWNFAGTFEERDVSSWAKARLTELCTQAAVQEAGIDAQGDPEAFAKIFGDLDASSLAGMDTNAGLEQLSRISAKLARMEAKVTKAKKLEGDAHIAVVRGTKRYLFDFTMQLDFEVQVDERLEGGTDSTSREQKVKKFKGSFNFEELSNATAEQDWECALAWKSGPPEIYRERVQSMTERLRHVIFQKVETFAAEYATM